MIPYFLLERVPALAQGVLDRLAHTDPSLLGLLLGCLVVFRILTLKRKPRPARARRPEPLPAAEEARKKGQSNE
jgi:hypothetical protein